MYMSDNTPRLGKVDRERRQDPIGVAESRQQDPMGGGEAASRQAFQLGNQFASKSNSQAAEEEGRNAWEIRDLH